LYDLGLDGFELSMEVDSQLNHGGEPAVIR
jgi:hypothetical protein